MKHLILKAEDFEMQDQEMTKTRLLDFVSLFQNLKKVEPIGFSSAINDALKNKFKNNK